MRRVTLWCLAITVVLAASGAGVGSARDCDVPATRASGGSLDPIPAPAPQTPVIGPGFALASASVAATLAACHSSVVVHVPTSRVETVADRSPRVRKAPPVRPLPLRI